MKPQPKYSRVPTFLLVGILLLAWMMRTFNLNWDDGYHFHPDERHITMVAEKLKWVNPVTNWGVFSSVDSPMNPNFFAYGSLPIYLLALMGWLFGMWVNPLFGQYDSLNLVGRGLSALFDTGTVLMVYLLARKLCSWRYRETMEVTWVPELAAALYAVCLLPIQLSHFYAVDTLLTFLVMAVLYVTVRWMEHPSWSWLPVIGGLIGLAAATKTTGLLVLVPVGLGLVAVHLAGIGEQEIERRKKGWGERVGWLVSQGWIVACTAAVTFLMFEPYAIIDFDRFVADHRLQSEMADNAWIFPYTLQYVETTPYVYPLIQILRWGMGWPLGLFGMAGFLITGAWWIWMMGTRRWGHSHAGKEKQFWGWLMVGSFVLIYFGFFGGFAVKFMRYMLPVYPCLVLLGAEGWWKLLAGLGKNRRGLLMSYWGLGCVLIGLAGLWSAAFLQIYTKPNTRIAASQWMDRQYGPLTELAIEHWDDALPVPPWHEDFKQTDLPLYEPDSEEKWQGISETLEKVDVIVIASNRLYTPLLKLEWKYPVTANYYRLLFDGALGFNKVAEFAEYPQLAGWQFPDQAADESFHVYDHPKVMVFAKHSYLSQQQLLDKIIDGHDLKD